MSKYKTYLYTQIAYGMNCVFRIDLEKFQAIMDYKASIKNLEETMSFTERRFMRDHLKDIRIDDNKWRFNMKLEEEEQP